MALRDITKKDFKALAYKATPKWELLKQQIRQQVLNGDFVPGDALPSETVLCQQSRLARSTVRQALDQLEKEGIIQRIQGKGTFVAESKSPRKHIKTMDVLCLVIPEVARDLYPTLINGFYEGALPINHQVMIATTGSDVYRQGDIMLQIIDKKMAGVAMVPTILKPTPPHHVRQLQNNGIPVVLCHRTVEDISAPLLTWDWKEVGRMATRFFLDRGHHRIGYYGFMRHVMTEQHVQGMQEVMIENGLMLNENSILFTSNTDSDEDKITRIQKKLTEPDHPTAIFCNDDTEAERVYWAAQEMGLKIPGDLAIMGFGNAVREGVIRRRLVSVTVSEFDLGKKAVKLLEEMRSGARPITNNEVYGADAFARHHCLSRPTRRISAGQSSEIIKDECVSKDDVAIVFENDDVVLVNKPTGISVTADRSGAESILQVLSRQLNPAEPLRLVHRLDKETSGILLIAKHRDAQSRYSRLFAKRLVHKLYLAIVKGPVLKAAGSIKDPIARSQRNPQAMHVHPRRGKPAHTLWKRLADFGGPALLAVQTITGRTHQIRIHFAHRGMPLVIDSVYGQTAPLVLSAFKRGFRPKIDREEPPMIDRLTLHAYQLSLPLGGDENEPYRTFVAVPDKNFLSAIKLLAKHTGPSKYVSAFEEPENLDRIINGQPLEFLES